MTSINMSIIFRYFIVLFVINLFSKDSSISCRSANQYTHSSVDCFQLCFGIRACVKRCQQGSSSRNRQSEIYENEDNDEEQDGEPIDDNYKSFEKQYKHSLPESQDKYVNLGHVYNRHRNGRHIKSYPRTSRIYHQDDYNPDIDEIQDNTEDEDTNSYPNTNRRQRKGTQFYSSISTDNGLAYAPVVNNLTTNETHRSPKSKDLINFPNDVVRIRFIGHKKNITTQIIRTTVGHVDPRMSSPSHCGLRVRNPFRGLGVIGLGRIVGGEDAEPNEFPWLVSLQLLSDGKPAKHFCGASIINKFYLLTAAHCTDSLRGKEKSVIGKAGINSPTEEGQLLIPEKFIIHEGWNADQQVNDIALIKLKDPVKYELNRQDQYIINSICLPKDNDDPVGSAVLAGWGLMAEDEIKGADWLQKITLPIWDRQKCGVNYRQYMKVLETHICAGGKGGQDSCMGDSGGPLLQKREDRTYQIGLVSFGIPCAIKGLPGVYTHLSHFMDWVKKNMV